MTEQFQRLFDPASIVVVGASSNPEKIGSRVLANLREGFTGKLAAVNPSRKGLDGVQTVADISELDWAPDIAYVAVPGAAVTDVLASLASGGTGFATIFTSGFAEVEGGRAEQNALADLITGSATRLLGPNCVGTMSQTSKSNGTFGVIKPMFTDGANIAIISQSGALGLQIMSAVQERGRAIGQLVTTGNEADVTATEVAVAMLRRDEIDVVGLVLESLNRPDDLLLIADEAARRDKTVILLRIGRSESGQRAAASHTGSMAVPDHLVSLLTEDLGLVEARTLADFILAVSAASALPKPSGSRVGIVTGSGGLGIIGADAVDLNGLQLPSPKEPLAGYLADQLPAFASGANPIDYTAHLMSNAEKMSAITESVIRAPDFDMVCVAQLPFGPDGVAESPLIRSLIAHRGASVVCCTQDPAVVRALGLLGIAAAFDPAEAIGLYARVFKATERRRSRGVRAAADEPRVRFSAVRETLGSAASRELLKPLGVRWPAEAAVSTAQDAVDFLEVLPTGSAIALKADASAIPHKTELNAIALGLMDPAAVRDAHGDLTERLGGVDLIAQEMIVGQLELVLGGLRNERLGPFVLFGLGGRNVEIMGGQAIAPAPATAEEAVSLIESAHEGRLVSSQRGLTSQQVTQLAVAVLALADLLRERPSIEEIDINPIIISADGPIAVDALITTRILE